MKRNLSKAYSKKIIGLVSCALVVVYLASGVFAQNKTLAAGDPPLTSAMVERYAGVLAWSLGVEFSAENRAAIEKYLVRYWQTRDEKNIKAVLDTLAFEEKLSSVAEAKKRELQPQVERQAVDALEKDAADPLSALLLGIYRQNQAADPAEGGAADLSALVGRWQVLHGNSLVGVDTNTGRIGDGNAMIAEYEIGADGRARFAFLLQQSNYGCTTRIKTSKTGRARVAGSRLAFSWDGGTTTSEDSCTAKNNYTKKLASETETLEFRLGRNDAGRQQFCFDNGKLKDCAVKVK